MVAPPFPPLHVRGLGVCFCATSTHETHLDVKNTRENQRFQKRTRDVNARKPPRRHKWPKMLRHRAKMAPRWAQEGMILAIGSLVRHGWPPRPQPNLQQASLACSFETSCLQKAMNKHCFCLGFLICLACGHLATSKLRVKALKPKVCLKMPSLSFLEASEMPQDDPRCAQDDPCWVQLGPKMLQDMAKMGPEASKMTQRAHFGPTWHQEAKT